MQKHEKFLEFNGNKMFFLKVDGTYWIALKPILDALNLESDRYLKKTKRDAFFSTCIGYTAYAGIKKRHFTR